MFDWQASELPEFRDVVNSLEAWIGHGKAESPEENCIGFYGFSGSGRTWWHQYFEELASKSEHPLLLVSVSSEDWNSRASDSNLKLKAPKATFYPSHQDEIKQAWEEAFVEFCETPRGEGFVWPEGIFSQQAQLLFVIDDDPRKTWAMRGSAQKLWDRLARTKDWWGGTYQWIFFSEQSDVSNDPLAQRLKKLGLSPHGVPIPPLNEQDIANILAEKELKADAKRVLELTKGHPRAVMSWIEDNRLEKPFQNPWFSQFDLMLSSSLQEEKDALWILSHFAGWDELILPVVRKEKTLHSLETRVLDYLKELDSIHLTNVQMSWREAYRDWHPITAGQRAFKFDRIQLLQGILEQVPENNDRKLLRKLGIFYHFHTQLLKAVFGAEADRLLEEIEHRPYLFQQGERCWRIAPHLERFSILLQEWIPNENDDLLREQIETLWKQKKKILEKNKAAIEKKIEGLRASHKKFEKEKVKFSDRITAVAVPSRPMNETRGSGSPWAGTFTGVLGILLLYLGILFNGRFNLFYSLMGIFLVLGGFYQAFRDSGAPTSTARARSNAGSKPDAGVHKDIDSRYLDLQIAQVKTRILSEERRLRKIVDELSEPYLY